ncbi:MAG: hypothetical protein ABIW84_00130, partial [Ilumatobacteraceae bacterium]
MNSSAPTTRADDIDAIAILSPTATPAPQGFGFELAASDLKTALSKLRPSVGSKIGIPALRCIHAEIVAVARIALTTTDLEITTRTIVACTPGAPVGSTVLLPYDDVAAMLAGPAKTHATSTLSFDVSSGATTTVTRWTGAIRMRGAIVTLRTPPADDFPRLDWTGADDAEILTYPGADLAGLLARAASHAS